MLQHSKLVNSRDEWRKKAVARANELREARKTQKRHQQQIAALKENINELQKSLELEKKK